MLFRSQAKKVFDVILEANGIIDQGGIKLRLDVDAGPARAVVGLTNFTTQYDVYAEGHVIS